MDPSVSKKMFLVLLVACVLSVVALLPYTLTIQGEIIALIPIPLHILLPLQILQNAILFTIFIFVGLRLSQRVGLRIPILETWLSGESKDVEYSNQVVLALLSGTAAGFLILISDIAFASLIGDIELHKPYPGQPTPPLWQTLLGLPYGAIAEEVALRLFAMSAFAWLFQRFRTDSTGNPTDSGMWLAVIISAILFGASHLPSILFFADLSLLHSLRIISLNAIGGIVFGWLYWRRGLEYAMISHFGMDIVLHVLLPPFL
ncbi:MAG: lysostaphin resistance A-like protein [Candidatus Hodarchaeota archaeon]